MKRRIAKKILLFGLRVEMRRDLRHIEKQADPAYADRVRTLVSETAKRAGMAPEWLWEKQFAGRDFTLTITADPDEGTETINVTFKETT